VTLAEFAGTIVLPILGLSLVLCVLRLARGPRLPDRIVALELMTSCAVAIAAATAVAQGRSLYLDVALIIALIAFLSTVAFARYLERTR
jgi:multicomponent Na+:H+ antiporter subunit F